MNNELMFLYYSGSKAYGTSNELSDIDVTAVFKNLDGIIHATTQDIDIFAYGYDSFLARQSMSDEVPLYNLIHADDIISIEKTLIFVDEIYKKDLEAIKKLDFYKVLPLYLEAFIKYYDDLINTEKVVVKRAYHILRLRAIIEDTLKTENYQINIDDKWIKKINDHKRNYGSLNTEEYLAELKTYLDKIIEIKNKYLKDDNNEVQV
jgi:hypothetical protein